MQFLLVLSVFVAAALAQEQCCLPQEFEIREGIIGSNDRNGKFESYIEERYRVYDFANRQSGWEARVDFLNGTRQEFKLIENYEQRVFWFIEDNKCTKQAFRSREPERCVTLNDTFIREFYVGDKAVYVDEWGKQIEHEGERGFETRQFVRGSCIPFGTWFVGEEERGGAKVRMTRTALYEDFIKGFGDFIHHFFDLPEYCPK